MGALTLGAGCKKETPPPVPKLAPNAPVDRLVAAESSTEISAVAKAMAPYVEQGRRTYPGAKQRFLAGLPPGHHFFATTNLRDSAHHMEQVFISVSSIKEGRIYGRIANEVEKVNGYKANDPYDFPESELIDWLISRPDGTEEGNVVGKFLDGYQVQHGANGE